MSEKNKPSSKDTGAADEKPVADPADIAAIEQAALSRLNGGRPGKANAGSMKLNPAFDSWLEGKLNKIFDTASVEPLPQDLMKLLEKIDQADAANKKKS